MLFVFALSETVMSYGHLSYRQKDTALGVGIGFLVISIVMILAAIAKRLKKCVSWQKKGAHVHTHTLTLTVTAWGFPS